MVMLMVMVDERAGCQRVTPYEKKHRLRACGVRVPWVPVGTVPHNSVGHYPTQLFLTPPPNYFLSSPCQAGLHNT